MYRRPHLFPNGTVVWSMASMQAAEHRFYRTATIATTGLHKVTAKDRLGFVPLGLGAPCRKRCTHISSHNVPTTALLIL